MSLIDAVSKLAHVDADTDSAEFNEALRLLQELLGQNDGGVAALFFSENVGDNWSHYSLKERVEYLKEYIAFELGYMEIKE